MLEILYRLQKLEAEEASLLAGQKKTEEYHRLRELKAEFERMKQALLQRQEQLTTLKEAMRDLPREVAEIAEKLEKERSAVYDGSIGNIRELTARQSQISALEERSAAVAGELAQKQKELRRATHKAKHLQQLMTDQHQQFTEQYRQYEEYRENCQIELNTLAAGKEALLSVIDEKDLTWYEAQKPLFAGLPVARLDDNHVCDGCRTLVTPILYKRTVLGERTRCEKCGRYLFIAEDQSQSTEVRV